MTNPRRITTNRNNRPIPLQSRRLSPRLKGFVAAACGLFLCLSCENQAVYDQYQVIENLSWEKDKEYYFTFQIEDASIPYDVFLEIRNNNKYPFQNLWLFCGEERPFGPLVRDTVECMLANEYGKWYGQGISLFHSDFPIRTHYYFPIEGQYTFSFQQGMREDKLPGIQEIGLRIVPASPVNAPSGKHPNEGK